ncbi:MAG: helix-turn-helix transcriptional regulator [Cognatishimia activa]
MPNSKRLIYAIGSAFAFGMLMLIEELLGLLGMEDADDSMLFEVAEFLILLALVVSAIIVAIDTYRMRKYQQTLEYKISHASSAFRDMLDAHFEDWQFSEAEREVTRLILKGCSIAEIAEIRDSKQGTIKAQTNSIYKKSGYAGKAQLLSAFLEELSEGASVA